MGDAHTPLRRTRPPSPRLLPSGLELPPRPEGGQNQTPRWIRTGFFLATGRVGAKVASPGAQHGLVPSCGSTLTSTGQWAGVRGEMTPVPGDISTDVRGQGPGTAAATAGVAGKCLLFGASSKQLSAQGKRREPERRPRCQGVRPPGHGFSALEPESAQVREGRQRGAASRDLPRREFSYSDVGSSSLRNPERGARGRLVQNSFAFQKS